MSWVSGTAHTEASIGGYALRPGTKLYTVPGRFIICRWAGRGGGWLRFYRCLSGDSWRGAQLYSRLRDAKEGHTP